jgi:hypothetical protein
VTCSPVAPGDDEIAVLQNLHLDVGKITHGCAPE